MAAKNHGLSPDLLIHPGETINDLLEERSITQKELSQRVGVSEAFLSDVIHGKKDISKGLAKGLEYAFGIPSSFWLNLQANYDAELLNLQEQDSVREEEISVLKSIHEIVDYLKKRSLLSGKLTKEQMVIELRKIFQISSLTRLSLLAPSGAFRISENAKINPDVLGAWLCLCKAQRSEKQIEYYFEKDRVDELVYEIKKIMMMEESDFQESLSELLAQYGIDFSIVHNFKGAPVHGYIVRTDDDVYQMVLTLRGAFADKFWFSLFHELGHIVNGDITKTGSFIDAQYAKDKKRESAADYFASNSLLEHTSYEHFLERGSFTYTSIQKYAKTQNVPSYVVIGRLQHDGIIPWDRYQKYKLRYKWAKI